MNRKRTTILMAVVGVLAFTGIVGLSLGAWVFASVFESETAAEPAATSSFDDVRSRFAGAPPVLDILDDESAVVSRVPPADRPTRRLERLQLMVWDRDDHGLSRVTLPFWVLRLKGGPLDISSRMTIDHHHLNMTAADIERYGPTLLVDHEGRGGDRLLIWTE